MRFKQNNPQLAHFTQRLDGCKDYFTFMAHARA